jgi:hypothetical protein
MKDLKGIVFGALISLNSFCGFSQQFYFNNIYNLCAKYDPEAWSAGITVVENGDCYVISGAAVDTLDFWMRRIAFIKLDNNGNLLWNKNYGDYIDDYYIGGPGSLRQINSGNFILAGTKDIWQPNHYAVGYLMNLDSEFDTIWTKSYNINNNNVFDTTINFTQLDICDNKDLIFSGSLNGSYMLLLRTDSSGITKWYKTFHYGNNTLCTGYSVIQTTDGGFALGGFQYTIGHPETGDAVIVKTDSLGNQEWVKYLGGPYLDNKAKLSLAPDGNIIMGTAYGESMTGDIPRSRIYIVKLDNTGNIIWENKYGSSLYFNFLLNIRTLENGSIIASGSCTEVSIYYGWILKVDMDGDSLWLRRERYFTGENSLHYLYDIIPTSDNGYLTCGDAIPINPDTGIRSAWVMKLDSNGCEYEGCDTTVGIEEDDKTVGRYDGKRCGLEVWPNPASSVLSVTCPTDRQQSDGWECLVLSGCEDCSLEIYDIFGRIVLPSTPIIPPIGGTRGGWQVNVESLPPGVYIAILKNGYEIVGSRKFVVARYK